MMSKKSPELRFKGFTDDWEERKLSDGTNKIGDGLHGTPKYSEDGEVYFVNGNNLVNGQIVITPETKRVTSNEQSKDDKALNDSTILMSINGTIGNLAWYRGENLMLGKSVAYIEVSDFDKKFIYAYLQTRPVKDYYLNSLTGTTIKNLGLKAIRNTNICTPTIDEQAKIGSFFKKLDDTIALYERKLDLLKEQKKGFLQKMFPKNGAKVPELRFAGFADDWEERKFSNLAEVRRGLTYKPSDVQQDGIRVLRSSNIAEDTFLIKSDDVFVNKEAVKIDKVKNGDILITAANGSNRLVGKHALIEGIENDTVHGGFMLVARAEKPEFVNAIMSSSWYSKFINIFVSGGNGAIGNLSKSDLENQKVYVPSEIEQTKIGLFFKQLDDTIALHQRKLDLLKEQKKGFLQKMFV